jgi:hypothetical protein
LYYDITLFVDDTTLIDIVTDLVQSDLHLNNDLLKIELWAKQWLVDFNPTKTVYMIFTSKQTLPHEADLIFFNAKILG